eukprot:GHRR01016863.1.p1 GENE.GHRR01016863.1~~GHRR01016863.1.p1  ORF type:complete len:501 (+),score=113.92 GHRR01016863.1:376-1878(+)
MDAFTYENGPFKFSFRDGSNTSGRSPTVSDVVLSLNPYRWSQTAHVLYIDSPAGTGFSYSTVADDYWTNDQRTIDDLELFLAKFFVDYPHLRGLQLYVAGESYAGVYVPLLAERLLQYKRQQRSSSGSALGSASFSIHNHKDLIQFQGSQASNRAGQHGSHDKPVKSTDSGVALHTTMYNLAGYILGNAVTDDYYDGNGQLEFAYGLGLIDPDTYQDAHSICKRNYWNMTQGSPCSNALDEVQFVMGPLNQYDILGTCFAQNDSNDQASVPQPQTARNPGILQVTVSRLLLTGSRDSLAGNECNKRRKQEVAQKGSAAEGIQCSRDMASGADSTRGSASSSSRARYGCLGHTIDCADRRHALVYYNDPDVRKAIHAASFDSAGRWEPCSDTLHYTHTAGSMLPIHKSLNAAGVRALVLSGDHDFVVPFTGTRAWVYSLGLEQRKGWHSWNVPGSKQVAGYAVEFEGGLTFATVKGAGHMVPQTKPKEALALLQLWFSRQL